MGCNQAVTSAIQGKIEGIVVIRIRCQNPFSSFNQRKNAMPSFDVVSEANMVEVRNAVDQANKE
ncbi:MAG: hypothetical protein H6R04_1375, partial [Burkholderiaceae bacterium]|nr:hypothetical protein [Burkholderiaceae bacterium]